MQSPFLTLDLLPSTRRALTTMGIVQPTPIQDMAIPLLLAGRDLVGQAVTGSGKTLAFSIPLVEVCDPGQAAVQALVLVPSRELAIQVRDVVHKLAGERGMRTLLLIGGQSLGAQKQALARGPQVVVGTPGRVLDLLRQGVLSLRQVRYVTLDESDEMLDRGFGPDVERILDHTPQRRQMTLFSATLPDWLNQVAARYLHNPVHVQIPTTDENRPDIDQIVYDVPKEAKLDVLRALLDERGDGSVLVFGRTKHGVRKLGTQLVAMGYPATALQGNLSQNARERVMDDFRSGRLPILVATNVAARGIDVESVERVINYELPESAELFTHRIGRTGRMGRSGEAITLLIPEDAPKWRQMERTLGRAATRRAWTFSTGRPSGTQRPAAAQSAPTTTQRPVVAPRSPVSDPAESWQQPTSDRRSPRLQPQQRTERSTPPRWQTERPERASEPIWPKDRVVAQAPVAPQDQPPHRPARLEQRPPQNRSRYQPRSTQPNTGRDGKLGQKGGDGSRTFEPRSAAGQDRRPGATRQATSNSNRSRPAFSTRAFSDR